VIGFRIEVYLTAANVGYATVADALSQNAILVTTHFGDDLARA
jgi:hypothetical protein